MATRCCRKTFGWCWCGSPHIVWTQQHPHFIWRHQIKCKIFTSPHSISFEWQTLFSFTQVLLRAEDVGKPRATICGSRLASLNRNTEVVISNSPLKDLIPQHHVFLHPPFPSHSILRIELRLWWLLMDWIIHGKLFVNILNSVTVMFHPSHSLSLTTLPSPLRFTFPSCFLFCQKNHNWKTCSKIFVDFGSEWKILDPDPEIFPAFIPIKSLWVKDNHSIEVAVGTFGREQAGEINSFNLVDWWKSIKFWSRSFWRRTSSMWNHSIGWWKNHRTISYSSSFAFWRGTHHNKENEWRTDQDCKGDSIEETIWSRNAHPLHQSSFILFPCAPSFLFFHKRLISSSSISIKGSIEGSSNALHSWTSIPQFILSKTNPSWLHSICTSNDLRIRAR